MKNKKAIIFSIAASLLVVLVLFVLPSPVKGEATTAPLHGYVWSMNIGWISLNANDAGTGASPDQYKVEVKNGALEGFAWSPSLGWLRFGSDLTGPSGAGDNFGAKIVEEGGKKWIKGWSRFCTVYQSGCSGTEKNINDGSLGSWDGWLKMVNVEYAPGNPQSLFRGYAWGGLNVGWVSFSYHAIDPPPGNSEICCNNIDDNSNGNIDEGCVCGGSGGPTVSCTAEPTTVSVGGEIVYTATVSDSSGETYEWTSEDGGLGPVSPGNSETLTVTYNDVGTFHVNVEAFNSSNTSIGSALCNGTAGVTISPSCIDNGLPVSVLPDTTACCSPDSDGDGFCGAGVESCKLNLNAETDNYVSYTEPDQMSAANALITINDCSAPNLVLGVSGLPDGDALIPVCAFSEDGVYNNENCNNLTNNSFWFGVKRNRRPADFVSGSSNDTELTLKLISGEKESSPLNVWVEYWIPIET